MKKETQDSKSVPKESKRLCIVLIRGLINVEKGIKDTLQMLNLKNSFNCVIIKDNPIHRGMLQKCKDYITWGEIDKEVVEELTAKKQKTVIYKGKEKILPFFRLHPPRGGFERRGIKIPFQKKGALGYRGSKINDLIKKML